MVGCQQVVTSKKIQAPLLLAIRSGHQSYWVGVGGMFQHLWEGGKCVGCEPASAVVGFMVLTFCTILEGRFLAVSSSLWEE